MTQARVLIGSCVRQDHRILRYFLDSLRDLRTTGAQVGFFFADDNEQVLSSRLLYLFRPVGAAVTVERVEGERPAFIKDQVHHHWNEKLTERVAVLKDNILRHGLREGYTHILLVDSDLILHPETLLRLLQTGKDIVCEVFWTRFRPQARETPQVWLADSYTLYRAARGEQLDEREKGRRIQDFFSMLRRPGLYRVGGLGACTLFSKRAVAQGVSFRDIYNLSFSGEDRHLCVRAAALGFELYADTHFPPFHIYREDDLKRVAGYLEEVPRTAIAGQETLLAETVKAALEKAETADFRRPVPLFTRKDRRSFFTARGWRQYQDSRDRRPRRTITRAGVSRLTNFGLDSGFSSAAVEVSLYLEGSTAGTPFRRTRTARLNLVNSLNGWQIDGLTPVADDRPPVPPTVTAAGPDTLVRVVRTCAPRITLAMLVRNEADRYLRAVLEHAARYVDEAVILDDASTDDTVALCRGALRDVPVTIFSNPESRFSNEASLRRQLWEMVLATSPDWILCLDADEVFEDRAVSRIRELVVQPSVDTYLFRLYDFWDEQHYRDDDLWRAHEGYRPLLVRHQPHFSYEWRDRPLHCGRLPHNVTLLPCAASDLRVRHLGWVREEDRRRKYTSYMAADPNGEYGDLAQYRSILDPAPKLSRWIEEPTTGPVLSSGGGGRSRRRAPGPSPALR